ncbi:hypothetical protein [Burkholderia anthina]|uniref:hypothetical protein n=1 Tax=Burkholderia anthina TaxID=179879 RepID=UPI001AA0AE4B|nr:hypothetical protein [Burkholderia anthina]QTD91777.1 hypothetical protein J4G50_26345 [Burkholderia anthina]
MMDIQTQLAMARLRLEHGQAYFELKMAHAIILNMLNLMTIEQQIALSTKNEADGISTDGATRYHERAALIETMLKTFVAPGDATTTESSDSSCATAMDEPFDEIQHRRKTSTRMDVRKDIPSDQCEMDAGYSLDAPPLLPAGSVRWVDAETIPPFHTVTAVHR